MILIVIMVIDIIICLTIQGSRFLYKKYFDKLSLQDSHVEQIIEEYRKSMYDMIEGDEEFTDYQKCEILECNELVAENLKVVMMSKLNCK